MKFGNIIDIDREVSPDKQEEILKVVKRIGGKYLKPFKEALPQSYSYEEIQLTLAKHALEKL